VTRRPNPSVGGGGDPTLEARRRARGGVGGRRAPARALPFPAPSWWWLAWGRCGDAAAGGARCAHRRERGGRAGVVRSRRICVDHRSTGCCPAPVRLLVVIGRVYSARSWLAVGMGPAHRLLSAPVTNAPDTCRGDRVAQRVGGWAEAIRSWAESGRPLGLCWARRSGNRPRPRWPRPHSAGFWLTTFSARPRRTTAICRGDAAPRGVRSGHRTGR